MGLDKKMNLQSGPPTCANTSTALTRQLGIASRAGCPQFYGRREIAQQEGVL
jgi:hypothetical protein